MKGRGSQKSGKIRAKLPVLVPALALLLPLAACGSDQAGISVLMRVAHHMSADEGVYPENETGAPRVFESDLGYTVTLTKGYVVFTGASIREPHSMSLLDRALKLLRPVALAHAHTESSPTDIGTPHIEDILHEDLVPSLLGVLAPPPAVYEHAHLMLGPADADAPGLPEDVPGGLVGKTLYFEGTHDADGEGGDDPVAFTVVSTAADMAMIHFSGAHHAAREITEEGLELLEPQEVTLTFGMNYTTWFDGVDFETDGDAEISAAVLANIVASLHLHAGMLIEDHAH